MRSYEVTAEFYDLLQAVEYRRSAQSTIDRWLPEPSIGVLDVGAGTGIATQILATRWTVPVHAVEPAAPMRAVLMSRLAGGPGNVRVYACGVERLGLVDAVDAAICLNTMAGLDLHERAGALAAVARALVTGGTFVVEPPPSTAPPTRTELPPRELGGDRYTADVTCTPVNAERIEWRFTYRVNRAGTVLRELIETFPGYLVAPEAFAGELAGAGLTPVDGNSSVVVARRD